MALDVLGDFMIKLAWLFLLMVNALYVMLAQKGGSEKSLCVSVHKFKEWALYTLYILIATKGYFANAPQVTI